MKLLRLIYLICCAFVVIMFMSCSKKTYDEESIILLGTESYVVPLNNFIPDSLKVTFPNNIGEIPSGYIPPNIEGEYVISQKEFCHSNFINLFDKLDMHLRISKQHNRVAKVEFDEGGTVVTDTAFIMGKDQLFTLYFYEQKNMAFYGNSFRVDRCVVITGEKTDTGIKNLMFGNVILDAKQGENPFIGNFIPGWYFIYKDKDGLSENCDWFDHQ